MSGLSVLAIEGAKLVRYLLDVDHAEGGPKARFFIANGFDPARPEVLARALASHATTLWPGATKSNPYGTKHVLDGALVAPDGHSLAVRSVWQIRADGRAWLVTAYPI